MMMKYPRCSRAGEPARSSTGAEVVAGGEGEGAGVVVEGEGFVRPLGLGDGEGEGGEEGEEEGGLVLHIWW